MWHKGSISKDDEAQIHMMESVIAAILFFGALQVGVNLIPDSQSTTALDTLAITGEDALRTLFHLPPDTPDAADYDNSSLIYFIATGRTSNITDFLNTTLDPLISYRLNYRTQPDDDETSLFDMVQTVEESVAAHFCFFHQGNLYDVKIVLWREPREVIV